MVEQVLSDLAIVGVAVEHVSDQEPQVVPTAPGRLHSSLFHHPVLQLQTHVSLIHTVHQHFEGQQALFHQLLVQYIGHFLYVQL